MIEHNKTLITAEDRKALDALLQTGWISQGQEAARLEDLFVGHYNGGAACALSSGTAALFIALKSLGIVAGEVVALPTYACSALLNAVYMAGAEPIPVDVMPDTYCLDPNNLNIQAANARYIISVNTFGVKSDIANLLGRGRILIEDCCHSLGSNWFREKELGESDVSIFSFYATKTITGGQGGLIWSRASNVIESAKDFRQFDCRDDYKPRFNFQMTDIQAALINSQMIRLQAICKRRKEIAQLYANALPQGFVCQSKILEISSIPYRFVIRAPNIIFRDALQKHMLDSGIRCIVPLEKHELLHRYLGLNPENYPVSESLADTTLSLPIYPALKDEELNSILSTMNEFQL